MIVEMMLNDNLEKTDKNKVILKDKIPKEDYNKKLYEVIKNMKKDEISLRVILSSVCYGFSTKNLKNIIDDLKENMLKDKLITIEAKKGIIGQKDIIKIDENIFNNLIETIRNELLGEEKITEDSLLLASLLIYTKFLKNIFNKYEKEELNERLKKIKDSDIAQKVKVVQYVISTMSAIVTSTMINATSQV